jgi:hypothetical protein
MLAELPGYRPEEVKVPFWLKESMTGCCAAARCKPASKATKNIVRQR